MAIKTVVRETLMVNARVVWLENDVEDYELRSSSDKEQTRLPDFTWQPKNLFLAITDVLMMNMDDLGLMAFKRFFTLSLGGKKDVKVGLSVPAKIAKSVPLSPKETEIMNSLVREATERSQLPQVVTKINEYIGNRADGISEV
jgi:hypothetical protein